MGTTAIAERDITDTGEVAFYRAAFESNSVVDIDDMPMRVTGWSSSDNTETVRFYFTSLGYA